MKLSGLLYFSAGLAAGAAGRAAYPKIKESLGPVTAAALAGAETAISDAIEAAKAAKAQVDGSTSRAG
jgi:hypothetical protein